MSAIPNYLLLTTETDLSADSICEEIKKRGIAYVRFNYADISTDLHELEGVVNPETICIPRQPYLANNVKIEFTELLSKILSSFQFAYIFERELYKKKFTEYEDKLFQSTLFSKLAVPQAEIVDAGTIKDFPLIAKKRLSSRSKGTFRIQNKQELDVFIADHDMSEFMLQRFYPLAADYRVLVLGGQVIGVAKRRVNLHEDGRVGVTVIGVGDVPSGIKQQAVRISHEIGSELCGFDVGEKADGTFFFIEYNTSPQFFALQRETGINASTHLIDYLESKRRTT